MKYLILCLAFVIHSCMGYSQNYEGTWQGKLDFGTMALNFVVHLEQSDGVLKATADSPDQGAYGLQATASTKGDSIFIQTLGGVKIEGKKADDSTINAIFSQNGAKVPLVLKKTTNYSKEISRPQEPKPKFPYSLKSISFQQDGNTLKGTLTLPFGKGKFPAVVLVSGSGPQNRDSELFGHKPFLVLSDYLTRNGIAVLRYDERGVGESEGTYANSTIADFSKDVVAAFEFLKGQDNIDTHKLGIIGHSEGGLIATLLAAQALPNLSFIVSLAGPAISIDKLMVEQLYAVGKANGMSEFNLALARKINEANFAVAKSDMNTEDAYQALLKNMSITSENKQNEALRKEMLTMLAPSQRYFYRIETDKYLPQIYIPVFAAYGTLDVQVPSARNLKSLYDHLPKNSKTVLKEYEDLNHLFQKAQSGKVSEYAQIDETFNEQVMKDISNWIKDL